MKTILWLFHIVSIMNANDSELTRTELEIDASLVCNVTDTHSLSAAVR